MPQTNPSTTLWHNPDFVKLWLGQTISQLGSQVTLLAFALTAESLLHATAIEMGILGALQTSSFLIVGLIAGIVVDRMQRRPILIVSDFARAALLATIPIAAFYSALTLNHLYVVAFTVGIFTSFFDVAYQAYLPSLVMREELVEGNSKLEVSRNIAQLTGPAAAGALIKTVSAPLTIALDSLSYFVSGLCLVWIEPKRELVAEPGPSVLHDLRAGLSLVFGNPILRVVAIASASLNFFWMMHSAVLILYLRRMLGYDELTIGILFAFGGMGGLCGAMYAARAAKRFGVGATLIVAILVFGVASFCVPFASTFSGQAFAVLLIGQVVQGISVVIFDVNQVSLRQRITPNHLQGRMSATMKFVILGTLPIGALIGGYLGDRIGLLPTLWISALGATTSFLWAYFSPLRKLES